MDLRLRWQYPQNLRYENPAFKTFVAKVDEISMKEVANLLPEDKKDAVIELNMYLMECFGSNVRLDYGTGHELAFVIFLYCLRELEVYGPEDYESATHHAFNGYISSYFWSLINRIGTFSLWKRSSWNTILNPLVPKASGCLTIINFCHFYSVRLNSWGMRTFRCQKTLLK